ncbi:Carboxylic ester hydrolase [Trichoderma simmonsii]|uniref:Carboxylic ester hydrolase n=1 Tax=Trichoderma simmonsii TaxID=1491479 RepID=A0A8G0LI64_9HYPO|nr:Carboxylic ester hydrolase [Trichoderma simmonsii]
MRIFRILAAAVLGGLVQHIRSDPIESRVSVNGGVVQGIPRTAAGVLEFLGIPFAAPPVGSLRWKPPQPLLSLNGAQQNAMAFGLSCYSAVLDPDLADPAEQGEDCLTVNVWTTAKDTTEKKAVMVWIYGGGFEFGASNRPLYNGNKLALDGVVLVSFNYRLGVLGFLALSELDDEGSGSTNFGLQDQLAALRWVRDNISLFGGDPDNVTIFGESAGGHSVGLLLASPLSTGLFHKGILESGALALQQKLNASSVAELRSLPAEQVNNAALWDLSTDPGSTVFAPSIDDYVVPTAPSVVFDNEDEQPVPILAGFNAREEDFFLAHSLPHQTSEDYISSVGTFFGNRTDEALQVYPGSTYIQANDSANALAGDLVIRQQTWEALDTHVLVGGHKGYGYYFTYSSPYSPLAMHTAEMNYVFGNIGPNESFTYTPPLSPADSGDMKMSETIRSYWTNFAKTGDPNDPNGSLPYWPSYTGYGNCFVDLGNLIHAINTPDIDRFQFIRSLRTNSILPLGWRKGVMDN